MGNRLSKIYTRTGDKGQSGLADGTRVDKNHPKMCAMGSVDELNSVIGLLINKLGENHEYNTTLSKIQHDLFNIGGEISLPNHRVMNEDKVYFLEMIIDQANATLPPLKEFILPGGSEAAGFCHLARSVARRAERDMITIKNELNPLSLQYLNRLSDVFFVLARMINKSHNVSDVFWQKK